MELAVDRLPRRALLPQALQFHDVVDEGRLHPGLGDTLHLCQRNDIRRRLFNDAKTIPFKLSKDGRLTGARRPRQYEPLHPGSAAMASRNGPISKAARGSHFATSLSL